MDSLLAPLARHLGLVTLVSAMLTVWSLAWASVFAAPLAVLFVVSAFGWSLVRLGGHAPTGAAPSPRRRPCAGCVAGCVECRERIELGEAA